MGRIVLMVTAALAMALMLGVAGAAFAHEGHTGCGAFGTGVGALAQDERPFGQSVVSPGPANEDILGFHATFREPKT